MDKVNTINITKLAKGDQKTYRLIFDDLYKSLCFFVNRFLDNPEATEDCVQESFIALWDKRLEMESTAHVKSFLYQVCRNNALNYLKHEKIKNDYVAEKLMQLESQVCFINFVIEEETERILAKTEKNLPPKCKEIFVMAMQGKSNAEIAEILSVSENTVKTQKKIAYKKLKDFIQELSLIILLLK